ncbi:hypothetical protein BO82DRAFT_43659 [Aspergillus uvarum CBS 121591]|uniref:Uncharacterized protein n=1 Tax=Aspergillus uvarum CBS 121591 TaxID=1448315 RepID=A0A319CHB6_9EURO|nr:hypothetical protein BO82DRAFT_43659 [Aspergillus uvarum CBS 121591]PYH83241.1 hypothetical protein BO82DRAFT_43659 [Aspergillus uvarum CBS 121591]
MRQHSQGRQRRARRRTAAAPAPGRHDPTAGAAQGPRRVHAGRAECARVGDVDRQGVAQARAVGRLRRRLLPGPPLREQVAALAAGDAGVVPVRRGELGSLVGSGVGGVAPAGSVELLPVLGEGVDGGAGGVDGFEADGVGFEYVGLGVAFATARGADFHSAGGSVGDGARAARVEGLLGWACWRGCGAAAAAACKPCWGAVDHQ